MMEKDIFEIIDKYNGLITLDQLQDKLYCSKSTIKRYIRRLKEKNYIKTKLGRKGGYYT